MAKQGKRRRFGFGAPRVSRSERQFQQAQENARELLALRETADPEIMARLLQEPEIKAQQRELNLFTPSEIKLFEGLLCKGDEFSIYRFYADNGIIPPLSGRR